jgi:type III restriction enzyme
VAFNFSHSALREGWDNPNVFQICTLNQTTSEVKKRQEVGRGVRLAVDQSGDRVRDERVNVLTVIANESYQQYCERLQSEIEDEYGKEGLPPKPADARKRVTVQLRKEYTLRPEFKGLWSRIKHKTRYAVKIDTEKLLTDVMPELDRTEIKPPRVTVTKAQLAVNTEDTFDAIQVSADRPVLYLDKRHPLPNLLEIMANLMEHTTPPVRLTRSTLLEVYKRSQNKTAAVENPHEFASVAVRIIKGKILDQLVNGIQYEKLNEWYEMTQFEDIPSWADYLVPADRSVYDHVIYDSDVERDFAKDLEHRDDVKLYLKLPSWFTVPTPVGEYNPDWAIVMEPRDAHGQPTGEELLYLVRETKSTADMSKLHIDEARKIKCGEKHFIGALGVSYKVVTKANELP